MAKEKVLTLEWMGHNEPGPGRLERERGRAGVLFFN